MITLTETTVLLRPQPLGVFAFPAGLLLLPPAPDSSTALDGLMRGDAGAALPTEWRFFALALEGDLGGALTAIVGDDAIARHNRMVLGTDTPHPDQDEGTLRILDQAARYALGRAERPPSASGLDGELLAFVLMLHATCAIEDGQIPGAIDALRLAIDAARQVSPEFAAQLLGQLASLEGGRPALALQRYREGIALACGPAKGYLYLQLGIALQDSAQTDRSVLLEAVKAYYEALRSGVTIERDPESFALLQNNLALAYLALPASKAGGQLRMGIAVQSLREALKVYTKEAYPEQWASTQLNLANALQYLPSSHPEENLIQAVEIYEEVLSVRQKAFDPVGYARLLANQANALAHLGIFGPAMEKIGEAYKLFQWHGEPDLAASAMSLVESISQRQGHAHGPS